MAAKAKLVAAIETTSFKCCWTSLLSPPFRGSPQHTTEPSSRIAAWGEHHGLKRETYFLNKGLCEISANHQNHSFQFGFQNPTQKKHTKKNYYIYSCGLEDRICTNLWVYRYQGTNALSVDWTCCTFTNWCCTKLQSPPSRGSPQHTTEPSIRIAANALRLAWICWTFPGENKWLGGWTSLSELTAKSGTPKQMMRTHEKVRFFVVRCCRIISLLLRIESQSQCWDSEPARFHWKFLVTSEGISQLNQLKRVELGGSHCPNYPFFTVIRLC